MECILKFGKENTFLFCGLRYNTRTLQPEIVEQQINKNVKPVIMSNVHDATRMIEFLEEIFPGTRFMIGSAKEVENLLNYDAFDLMGFLNELADTMGEDDEKR
ncbi:hypothetical protein [Anaerorhabdus sp.]|uniref:hypothetical protein n=1 Tax=Anaerorhabdus sp. TaxID=1872524 RepID=UPI002FC733E5